MGTFIHNAFCKIAGKLTPIRRQPNFVCGDCERSARCGLPPSDNCIAKAEQIARDNWKFRRRARMLSPWGV